MPVTYAAPVIVASWPFPDKSRAALPLLSSKVQYAMASPAVADGGNSKSQRAIPRSTARKSELRLKSKLIASSAPAHSRKAGVNAIPEAFSPFCPVNPRTFFWHGHNGSGLRLASHGE